MSMLRSYHVSNYGWTPLSQNSCWNAAICCSSRLYMSTNRQAFGFVQDHKIVTALGSGKTGPRWCWKTSSNIGRDKSFVYDLNTRPSIVRVRVGFVSRSAEIQLVSLDLCCQLSFSTSSYVRIPQGLYRTQGERDAVQATSSNDFVRVLTESLDRLNSSHRLSSSLQTWLANLV